MSIKVLENRSVTPEEARKFASLSSGKLPTCANDAVEILNMFLMELPLIQTLIRKLYYFL